ncbi:MAG: type IV pili twitching motility protein PilT, partial [Candidatus Omnitrophica bacterium]|nr:type IV pili twitching motility protein PilT [Candidatus Omnitrophota bacterium]
SFSPDEQPIIRNMVCESLRGVVCQQLIPKLDGTGLVPAYEVLIMTSAVSALIKGDRTRQLNNVIATGKGSGMVLFDNDLQELVQKRLISGYEAYRRAVNPVTFAQYANERPVMQGGLNA